MSDSSLKLTLAAEVRRQAAAKKVEALLKIARISDTLITRVMGQGPEIDASQRIAALDGFWLAVREAEALMDKDPLEVIINFGHVLVRGLGIADRALRGESNLQDLIEASRKAEDFRRVMLATIRRELQLVPEKAVT